jgi:hypothetical protein
MIYKELRFEDVGRIHLAQVKNQWRAIVNTVMNLRIRQTAGNFLISWANIGCCIQFKESRNSSVGIVLGYGLDDRGSLFITASRTALEPTQPPIQWVPGGSFSGVKGPGHEADHSPPSNAEVKECVELNLHSPNEPSWRGAQLSKAQGRLYFFLKAYSLSYLGAQKQREGGRHANLC